MAGTSPGPTSRQEFPDAPHGEEVFERYPQVGVLRPWPGGPPARRPRPPGPPGRDFAGPLSVSPYSGAIPILWWCTSPSFFSSPPRFLPSLPAYGCRLFETTAFHCLGGGVLFTPVALLTGLLTWWLNYDLRPLRPVVIKLILTPSLLAVGTGAFIWRWLHPEILAGPGGLGRQKFTWPCSSPCGPW